MYLVGLLLGGWLWATTRHVWAFGLEVAVVASWLALWNHVLARHQTPKGEPVACIHSLLTEDGDDNHDAEVSVEANDGIGASMLLTHIMTAVGERHPSLVLTSITVWLAESGLDAALLNDGLTKYKTKH